VRLHLRESGTYVKFTKVDEEATIETTCTGIPRIATRIIGWQKRWILDAIVGWTS
jgi:hypothetical protein